ncbi:cation efflux family-domain-containing protein [Peziza echinospora]|nr:cation efflux family-domain-containing protein [Peziza echinospora]
MTDNATADASTTTPHHEPSVETTTNQYSIAADPFSLEEQKKQFSKSELKESHPNAKSQKEVKQFYAKQNELIDSLLNSHHEEVLDTEDYAKNGGKVRLAVNMSTAVNFVLFAIQLYAAISTKSLALFATAADAFMDMVSSVVMLWTSRVAAKPSIYKYPVGRTRVETVGIIVFCSLMSTLAVQLIVESARAFADGESDSHGNLQTVPLVCVGIAIGAKLIMFIYCFSLRRYPVAMIFALDHRNDLAVNGFGLIMSILGFKYVWYLDPLGAILIAVLILYSWGSTAFEHLFLLVGKSAPQEFLNKLTYLALTHDSRIIKIDTVRAYRSGPKYYVEVDIIMAEDSPLRVTHDVAETLQRKVEGLADVERGFVHVDYEDTHLPHKEHRPVYEGRERGRTLKELVFGKKKDEAS